MIKTMNQRGFAKIAIIILVIVLAGALGYAFFRRSALLEQPQTDNSRNAQAITSPSQLITSKENAEYHLQIQGNPSYKAVALSDVSRYGISSNNFVTTSGTVVFVESRTDGTYYPRLVLKDNSATAEQISYGGGYILISVGRAFESEFAPVFSKINIGDTVQVWGTAEMTQGVLRSSSRGTMIETRGDGIAGAPYFGLISLTGIKKD